MNAEEPKELDLSKYRTDEVVDKISGVLGLVSALKITFGVVLLVVIGTILLPSAIFNSFREYPVNYIWSFCGAVVGVMASVIILPGILLSRILGGLVTTLELLVDILEITLDDINELNSGSVVLPSARQLVQTGYRDIILPIIEDELKSYLPWFATPLIWIYDLIIGKFIRVAINYIPLDLMYNKVENFQIEAEFENHILSVSEQSGRITTGLMIFRNTLSKVKFTMVFILILPCYISSLGLIAVSISVIYFLNKILWYS